MPKAPPLWSPCRQPFNPATERARKARVAKRQRKEKPHLKWYGSRRWRRRREKFLADNPWCVTCLEMGLHVEARHADHSPPHNGDMERFFHGSLVALCASCHSRKTAREDGGFGNPKR